MIYSAIHRLWIRILRLAFPQLGLRDTDIILASFPKSGNTWVRFIWANMVSVMEFDGAAVDFNYLMINMVAQYDNHKYGTTEYKSLPRLVKTHKIFSDRTFGSHDSVYIIRHPGDVMVSYYEYINASKRSTRFDSITDFITDDYYGISSWCRNVASWQGNASIVVKYEDLQNDSKSIISDILEEFNIDYVNDNVIGTAVERSSFERMQSIEMARGRPTQKEFTDGFIFMRKGRTGEWRDRLSDNDVAYINAAMSRFGVDHLYEVDSSLLRTECRQV